MTAIHVAELVLCAGALIAFGWGMAYFFQRSSRSHLSTRAVAVMGTAFAAWHLWAIWASVPHVWLGMIAMALYAAAMGLFTWAVRTSRRRQLTAIFEKDTPRHLEVEGPFQYLRHPFYAAYIAFWWAGAMASRSWVSAASALVMSWVYVRAARLEEAKFQVSSLSEEHAEYCRCTPFMLPGVRLVRWRGYRR